MAIFAINSNRIVELQQQAEFMAKQAAQAAEAVKAMNDLQQAHEAELAPLEEAVKKLNDELAALKATHQSAIDAFVKANPILRGVKLPTATGAKVTRRTDGITCKSIILTGLDEGKAPKDIVADVLAAFPDSKCSVKDVYWHRGQLKKAMA